MHPHNLERLKALRPPRHIIDRCNLTILLEPGYEDYASFLARNQVEIIASMPCYSPENVNAQRGNGVFDGSINALQLLNSLGYGIEPALPLHLVQHMRHSGHRDAGLGRDDPLGESLRVQEMNSPLGPLPRLADDPIDL
jgi:hypothetical protein